MDDFTIIGLQVTRCDFCDYKRFLRPELSQNFEIK